ncbi:Phage late control D family protein [Methylorubrum aminovorans]
MPSGHKPTSAIFEGGQDITARFQDRCTSIVVELMAGGGAQDSVTITLDDRDYKIASPQVKDRLDVSLSYEGIGVAFMGSFKINKIVYGFPPRTITVCSTTASSLNDLKTQRVNNITDKTVEQIPAEVGNPLGSKIDMHPSIADSKIPQLDSNTSFGSLINRLERQYDAVAKITDGRVSLVPHSGGSSVSDFAQPTYVLRDYSFADLEVTKESRGDYSKVVADYLDENGNRTPAEAAESSVTGLDSQAIFKIPNVQRSKEEAAALAKSTMAQLDRSGDRIAATLAEGDPWVRDLQRVVVAGIRPGIDGSYTLDAVRHTYEKGSGLRTTFSGQGGVNGLASEFASATTSGGNTPSTTFLTVGPGQVFGQALGPAETVLPGANTDTPRLIGAPIPNQ